MSKLREKSLSSVFTSHSFKFCFSHNSICIYRKVCCSLSDELELVPSFGNDNCELLHKQVVEILCLKMMLEIYFTIFLLNFSELLDFRVPGAVET